MVTVSEEYCSNIAKYLKTPLGEVTRKDGLLVQINKNETKTGIINIVFSLLKQSNTDLSPRTILEIAQIRQWLEYISVYVSNANSNQNINIVLKDLNTMLATKTYLVGNRFTIADVCLYFSILNIMTNLSIFEKEKFLNVSRWFDNIQQDPALRHKNSTIDFSTNYIASIVPSKH